jgi:hypothetical protein
VDDGGDNDDDGGFHSSGAGISRGFGCDGGCHARRAGGGCGVLLGAIASEVVCANAEKSPKHQTEGKYGGLKGAQVMSISAVRMIVQWRLSSANPSTFQWGNTELELQLRPMGGHCSPYRRDCSRCARAVHELCTTCLQSSSWFRRYPHYPFRRQYWTLISHLHPSAPYSSSPLFRGILLCGPSCPSWKCPSSLL